jgi:hypothetical protein
MDNFYLKYAEDLPYPIPSTQVIKENYLCIWKKNIINELSILKNLFLEKYSLYLNDKIIAIISKISTIIEHYRYLFLEQYLYYLNNDDKFYIDINDEINIFKIKFIKEIYNKILLLIDNLCSCNKILSLIYQDKLKNYETKKNSITENLKVEINNEEILNKLYSDIDIIEKEFENKKNIFNFKNNQNILYPKKEELNKLFDEFNINNYNNNLEINHKLKRNPNQIVRDKLLSKKTDIVIKKDNPEFEELLEIAKNIQEIKNDIKNIKEKQMNYCASSMIDKNFMKDEFNNIKANTIKINSDVEGLKDEIKEYNNKYKQIINNIDNHHNKYLDIKKRNDDINNKINIFIKQYK